MFDCSSLLPFSSLIFKTAFPHAFSFSSLAFLLLVHILMSSSGLSGAQLQFLWSQTTTPLRIHLASRGSSTPLSPSQRLCCLRTVARRCRSSWMKRLFFWVTLRRERLEISVHPWLLPTCLSSMVRLLIFQPLLLWKFLTIFSSHHFYKITILILKLVNKWWIDFRCCVDGEAPEKEKASGGKHSNWVRVSSHNHVKKADLTRRVII